MNSTRCHSERSEEPLNRSGCEALRFAQGDSMGRRTFFRALWFVAIGGVGAVLLRRSCTGKGVCNSCTVYGNCALPWKEARR